MGCLGAVRVAAGQAATAKEEVGSAAVGWEEMGWAEEARAVAD